MTPQYKTQNTALKPKNLFDNSNRFERRIN